ncbi:hypothetical protein GCM10007894_26090 [Paraferrimonas haliotis]|uniref:Uncharacterized protein n=2 Tax=Paraferrimonas haliotis TaxID=2013866 RepID=A0AA37WXQ0_9GAMM|nr:hypothetical protein GCM10007894_26090 [Paraferrimonas haliotis]
MEIGDWEGEEELAADNLNRIYHSIYAKAADDVDPSALEMLLEAVWDYWQHNPGLTELDEDEIEAFVEWLYNEAETE